MHRTYPGTNGRCLVRILGCFHAFTLLKLSTVDYITQTPLCAPGCSISFTDLSEKTKPTFLWILLLLSLRAYEISCWFKLRCRNPRTKINQLRWRRQLTTPDSLILSFIFLKLLEHFFHYFARLPSNMHRLYSP